jgi:hypothetical protein
VASLALPSLLQPAVINERINRLNVINDRFQRIFGMKAGGPNVRQYGGRRFSWDIFNSSRVVPDGRTPGAPASTMNANPVGHVAGTFPRMAQKLPLPLEELNNLRPIGGPVADLDIAGQSYITEQEMIIKQQVTNLREFQLAAMCRGSYTYTVSGDALIHGFSGGAITVDFQIPSTNKTNLNGIISALWSNNGTKIVDQLFSINATMQQLVGRGLKHCILSSVGWGYVVNNTQVINQAGTASRPWETFTDDGDNGFMATLRAYPQLVFHVIDDGINLNVGGTSTFTKLIDDTHAIFLPDPSPDIASAYEGSEMVVEWVGRTPVHRFGEYYWAKPMDDPAGFELHSIYNGIPALKNPSAIMYGAIA